MIRRQLVAVVLVTVATSGCRQGSSEPVGPARPRTDAERRGQTVFYEFCNKCHPQGEAGLGPALGEARLPIEALRARVRAGSTRMPGFSRYDISEADLYALIDYVDTLQDAHAAR